MTTVISKWLPELLPTVLGIALDPAHHKGTPLDSILLNQLLWICARFGCATTPRETELIIQAQGVIVDYMTRHDLLLDTKGYLAIAYVVREDSPERALAPPQANGKVKKGDVALTVVTRLTDAVERISQNRY